MNPQRAKADKQHKAQMKSMCKVQKASGVRSLADTQLREKCATQIRRSSQGHSTNGHKRIAAGF
jgi:hypothetical protein